LVDRQPGGSEFRPIEIAWFDKLRDEIVARSGHQQALIALGLTAAAAVGSVAGADPNRRKLLVVLVLLSPALTFLWSGHAVAIDRIGGYLGRSGLGGPWEANRGFSAERALLGIPILMLMLGPGVASLVFTRRLRGSPSGSFGSALQALWWSGVVLAALAFVYHALWILAVGTGARERGAGSP
jgi:hypothetical protein